MSLDGVKILGQKEGRRVTFDPSALGTNIVLTDVPCETSVYIGAAVIMKVNGEAKNALADSLANSNVIGIVESKPSVAECNIRVIGATTDIYTGLDVTKEYYLSATVAGELTTSIPTASGHVILKVGQPFSANSMLFMKSTRIVRA